MKPNDKAIDAEAVREVKSILNTISTVTDNETIAQNIVGKIIAAYAAQFQSGDYAGLLERLRLRAGIFKDTTDDRATADAIEMLLAKLNNKPKPSENYAGLVKELRKDISDPTGKMMSDWDEWRKYISAGGDGSWPRDQFEGHLDAISELHHSAADAIEALLAERDDFAEQLALRSESGMAKDMQEIMRINNELVAERDALAACLAPVDDKELGERVVNEIRKQLPASGVMYIHIANAARVAIAAIRPHIEAAERERCAKRILETNWVDADPEDIAAAIRSGK